MFIGAHVSTSGGLKNTLENGKKIGAEALQIFPSAPVRWTITGWNDEECAEFKKEWPKHFKDIIFHGIYLTNLAANNGQNYHMSKASMIDTMKLADKLGITGVAFHPGSYVNNELGNFDKIKVALNTIQRETPSQTKLIFENSSGSTIGGKLEDLAWLIDNSPDKNRTGVCLDTCHAFAAGYDVSTREGYQEFMNNVDKIIGIDKVFCWHFNDSKFALGEKRDRHENIGEGKIGKDAFGFILNDSRWKKTASYLEVPGFKGKGPDKKNIERLKSLRRRSSQGAP